jgi:hypothetical protein
LYFESEKEEMFNKFIHEQFFFTNRQCPSRDVAVRYIKQAILKHALDGGSWIDRQGKRTKYGTNVVSLGREFFGAREFAEHNYTAIDQDLTTGFKGVFQANNTSAGNYSFLAPFLSLNTLTAETIYGTVR